MSENNAKLSAPVRAEAAKTPYVYLGHCEGCEYGITMEGSKLVGEKSPPDEFEAPCPRCDNGNIVLYQLERVSASPVREAEPLKALESAARRVIGLAGVIRVYGPADRFREAVDALSAALEGAAKQKEGDAHRPLGNQ